MFIWLELLLAATPTYLWRFKIAGQSTNFLEVFILVFWLAFAVWLSRKKTWQSFWQFIIGEFTGQNKFFGFAWLAFLAGALISVFDSSSKGHAAGQFLAFFFQPAVTYFLAKFIWQNEKRGSDGASEKLSGALAKNQFIFFALIIAGIFGAYGIFQYLTLHGLPTQWWGNSVEPRRALSIFEYPNAFALWMTPILALTLPQIALSWANKSKARFWAIILWLLGAGGLLLSLSRLGWLGLVAAVIAFIFLAENKQAKKLLLSLMAVAIVIVIAVPNLRWRIILPFIGDKSASSRVILWQAGSAMIKSSPILGKGLLGFQNNFSNYINDKTIPAVNYPHNIFLNFWVDTGLLGLLGFTGIFILTFQKAWLAWRQQKNNVAFGVLLFLIAIFFHGLGDVPYLKNDLALVFWLVIALI